MNFQEKLNAVQVTIEDLDLAVRAVHATPPEVDDVESRMAMLTKLFDGQSDKSAAIEARLTAMAHIITAGILPEEAAPMNENGAADVTLPIWQAAATVPLVICEEREQIEFDPSAFLEAAVHFAGESCKEHGQSRQLQ